MSSKLLESNWNLLKKCVFARSSLQHIRLQELPLRSTGKTYGRAFPPRAVWASPQEERGQSSVLRDWLPIHTQPCGRSGYPLVPVWSKGSRLVLSPAVATRGSLFHTVFVHRSQALSEKSWATMPDLCVRWGLWLSCCSQAENIHSPKTWQSDGAQYKTEGWSSPLAAPLETRSRATRARKGQAEAQRHRAESPSSTHVRAHPCVPMRNCRSHRSGRWWWKWAVKRFVLCHLSGR